MMQFSERLSGHSGSIYSLASGPDDLIYTGGADKVLASWSLNDLKAAPFSVKLQASLLAVYYRPENHHLYLGTSSGNIHLIDLANKTEVRNLVLHTNGCFDLLPLSDRLITLGGDGYLTCIDYNGEWIDRKKLSDKKLRRALYLSQDALVIVGTGDGDIAVLSSEDLSLQAQFRAHEGSVFSLAWHPEKKVLISGGADAHLRFWDLSDGNQLVHEIPAHNYAIYDIVDTGEWFATASRDKTVKIWNRNFDLIQRFDRKQSEGHLNSVNRLLWDEKRRQLISASDDRTLIIWS
ncbi:hypothetical protein KFE98_14380 [bacterium SCSIO 12741]|nr:hypothetical protein KFE98_14380 [bacterium SCSIO 12741]